MTNLFCPWTYLNLNHLNSTRFTKIRFTTKYSITQPRRKTRPYCIVKISVDIDQIKVHLFKEKFYLKRKGRRPLWKRRHRLNFSSLLVTWCTNSLTFNNCTFCPHCIYVFCIYLRTNSDLCHLQHKLIGFYNRDEKCLQSGTDWVFK